jgi:hypothetical protein
MIDFMLGGDTGQTLQIVSAYGMRKDRHHFHSYRRNLALMDLQDVQCIG